MRRRTARRSASGPAENAQTVLVTGASSGIGATTADLLAAQGLQVFGTSRRDTPSRPGVRMLNLDVRDAESVRLCVQQVLARTGRIDVLVNNAGVLHFGLAEETTMAEAENVFSTNFFGVVRMVDAVLPLMRSRGGGRVVNVGSLAAWVGEPGEAFYAASKAALARYSEALRHELAPFGIPVSLVEPGPFVTDVLRAAPTSAAAIDEYHVIRGNARRVLDKSWQRGGDPAEVAALIARVVHARAPRRRYGAGHGAQLVPCLAALLPQQLIDHLVRRAYYRARRK